MANLVSPGYKKNTLINGLLYPEEERTVEFKGLNRKPVIEDGEMPDMWNLTSDNYPLLTPRKPRGELNLPDGLVPLRITSRYGRLALVARDSEDNTNFYYDGEKVASVTGLGETTRMVAINNKICFFPQKTYLEINTNGSSYSIGEYGSLDAKVTLSASTTVTISNEDVRISVTKGKFAYDDAINISGTLSYTPSGSTATSKSINVSCAIEDVVKGGPLDTTDTLVLPRETFIELTGEGATDVSLSALSIIERPLPDVDYVLEWNNRLWGACIADNTIYACKLGDPKNWQYYQGTSLDSFYAQQGTDGIWSGCAAYSSHVIFFKQNSMTRVYGSSPATFQIANTQCFGCREGSRDSVTVINDKVFYNSIIGIMCYDGGSPYLVSDKLQRKWKTVVGGQDGNKYYASAKDGNTWELLVLDIDKAVWHKEDDTRFVSTCTVDNQLYYIVQESESIKCSDEVLASKTQMVGEETARGGAVGIINPIKITEDAENISWSAVFGPFDEFMENRKIYSKLLLRLVRNAESEVSVYIAINEGEWELVQVFDPTKTGGDYIPIVPRRCDRYSVKIEGKGKCSIKSLTRKVRMGTGGRL